MSAPQKRRPRVFLGLSDICGYYSQLEEGLRARGFDTVFLNAFPHKDYGRRTSPDAFGRVVERIGLARIAAPRGSLRRKALIAAQAAVLPIYGATALLRFDVFVFASGQSFLLGRDRRVLRWFGRRVISVCHGTDSRPPYLNGAVVPADGPIDVDALVAETMKMKRFVRVLEDSSDVVVQHPLTAQFHEKRFVNFFVVGYANPLASGSSTRPHPGPDDELVALHAPTRPGPKGTAEITRAVEALRARGIKLRLETIIGRPPAEVLAAIERCDFVIDELYSDSPVAGFASEAARFGKPAIVGSYGTHLFEQATGRPPRALAYTCHPDDLEAAIEAMATDPNLRERIGRAAQRFVLDEWSADGVAERFGNLIEDTIPASYWCDPKEVQHAHGWGLRESRVAETVRALVKRAGRTALAVADKPELEARLVALAEAVGLDVRTHASEGAHPGV